MGRGKKPSGRQGAPAASLSDPKTPQRLYHAAPASERESILSIGLDPTRYPRQRWSDDDKGIWCFDSLKRALDYAEGRTGDAWGAAYDVWEVDGSNLLATRPWFDAELNSGIDVWYVDGPVAAAFVRLASAAADG